MKAIFGFGFFLLFLAGIALVMLQGRQLSRNASQATGDALDESRWRPVYIGAAPVAADSGMFVRFTQGGGVEGHGGCNAFSGPAQRTASGISIGPLMATRKACPEAIMDREMALMNALQAARYAELGGQRLQLSDANRNLVAELVADD